MTVVHHSAICVGDVDASLRFWRDGLGFEVLMDHGFDGDWPKLLGAPSRRLRAVFLGDPGNPDSGIVELVDFGTGSGPAGTEGRDPGAPGPESSRPGFLLVSVLTDVDAATARLAELGLGGPPRQIEVAGVAMVTVVDPDGVVVELVDRGASANLARMVRR